MKINRTKQKKSKQKTHQSRLSHMRATLRRGFCERGRNGEGGRSVSRLVFLTSKATVSSDRYYYYWRGDQNWDRSRGFTLGQMKPVLGRKTCPTWHCPNMW